MPEAAGGSVQLLEADPDLARGLDPRRIREVSQRLFVRAIDAPRGPWTPGRTLNHGSQPIGLLVLDGLLVREATVGDHPCAELLGPGVGLRGQVVAPTAQAVHNFDARMAEIARHHRELEDNQ